MLLPARTKKERSHINFKILIHYHTSLAILQSQTEICYSTVDDNIHSDVSEQEVCKYGMYSADGREFY
jgi:hypothetical protein